MEIVKPINVSWLISDKCNYSCKFCFMPPKRKSVSFKQAINILENLVSSGVKKISFGGGEPLLLDYIGELIIEAKRMGLITMLLTNGSLLSLDKINTLDGYLDWLSLPLEGPDEKTNILMTRPPGHFQRVLKIFEYCRDETKIRTKINTVVTKRNIDSVTHIINIVVKFKVARWKLFQFYPIRFHAKYYRDLFEIDEDRFNRIRFNLVPRLQQLNISFSIESINDLQRSYVTLSADGFVYVSIGDRDVYLGDTRRNSLLEIWENPLFDKELYSKKNAWLQKSIEGETGGINNG